MTTDDGNMPTKWELWAKEKKPSMKRRSEQHDYYGRCIYMITMATEGRKPLLGRLLGDPDATDEARKPRVAVSPLGEKVQECWQQIPIFHPSVQPLKLCIMPDHIHGILFVHERMEKHLGTVIEGFKTGTRKAARELGLLPPAVPFTAPVAQSTQQRGDTTQQQRPTTQQQQPSRHTAAGRAHGQLWEPGYHDRILTGRGQLERMNTYLDDNPRRLLIKRQHPEFFTQRHHFVIDGIPFEGIGNRFLLDNPLKIQVQCSRKMTAAAIARQQDDTLEKARKGYVVVSPCISPGEQQIATAAMNGGAPLIVLLLKGFHPYFKPQPQYLDACRKGLLLMMTPFPWQNEQIENMRQRCLQLNAIALKLCAEGT